MAPGSDPQARTPGSWWQTLPGVVTAVAGLLTALAGLLIALHQVGLLHAAHSRAARDPNAVAAAPPGPAPLRPPLRHPRRP